MTTSHAPTTWGSRPTLSRPLAIQRYIGRKARPAPAGAGTPGQEAARLRGSSGISMRALKRASRSTQQIAKARAENQPRTAATAAETPKVKYQAGATPNDIESASEFHSAPKRTGLSRAGDSTIDPVQHASKDHRRHPDWLGRGGIDDRRAFNGKPNAGQADAERGCSDGIGHHRSQSQATRKPPDAAPPSCYRSLADALDQRSMADFRKDRLASDYLLAEQDLGARPCGR